MAVCAGPLSDTLYHRVSARVLSVANQLRQLGVDGELQVPTLVIAGDQSSGKSSVLEAIAGVALPRSDGTCTRCPTEVRMNRTATSASTPEADAPASAGGSPTGSDGGGTIDAGTNEGLPLWSCHIKLARDFDDYGGRLVEKPEEEPFCVVKDKAHIAQCVTAAQAVLLNPKAVAAAPGGVADFVPALDRLAPGEQPSPAAAIGGLGDAQTYELAFTYNKVVLDIRGAEADLTIVDLPGIIHDHPKGNHVTDLVKKMAREYVQPDNHIIAMTIPAASDLETQFIRSVCREADPAGHRCIGIITKPDTLKEEERIAHGKLIKLVGGSVGSAMLAASLVQQGHLRCGYYVVRNPSQEQLLEGITFASARDAEGRFFASNDHWAKAVAATPALAARLGANHLRAGLSELLVERIEEQLPAIRRSAREKLAAVVAELAGMLPPPSADPLQELRSLLWQVAERMERAVLASGVGTDKQFYQHVHSQYRQYGERLICSTPAFLVGRTLISALSNVDKGVARTTAPAIAGQDGRTGRQEQQSTQPGMATPMFSFGEPTCGMARGQPQSGRGGGSSCSGVAAAAAPASQSSAKSYPAATVSVFGAALTLLPASSPTAAATATATTAAANAAAAAAAAASTAAATSAAARAAAAAALAEGEVDVAALAGPEAGDIRSAVDAAAALKDDATLRGAMATALFPDTFMALEEVAALRAWHVGGELPGFSPYSAVQDLIQRFKGRWSGHALRCLDDVAAAAQMEAAAVAKALFGRFPRALRAISAALSSYVDELASEAGAAIKAKVSMEDLDTFTLNNHYLEAQYVVFLGRLKRAHLQKPRPDASEDKEIQLLLAGLARYGLTYTSFHELYMAQPTEVEEELKMMAACLAYFKVAFKRVQDDVPMTIRNVLLRSLADRQRLEGTVMAQLALCTPAPAGSGGLRAPGMATGSVTAEVMRPEAAQVARGLLSEDEAVAAQRVTLRDMERRLREAVAVLSSPAGTV